MDKVVASAAEAVADIADGSSLAVGGFGLCGIPVGADRRAARGGRRRTSRRSRTTAASTTGGSGSCCATKRLRRMVASYVGENKEFARQYLAGELEVELTPQGTLAERMRAGGSGIPAFFTATGVGTQVAEGGLPWRYDGDGNVVVASPAEGDREFDVDGAAEYVLEQAIVADFGLVRAWKGDRHGNLVFRDVRPQLQPARRDVRPGHDRRGRGAGRARARSTPNERAHPGRLRAAGVAADRRAGRATSGSRRRTVRTPCHAARRGGA